MMGGSSTFQKLSQETLEDHRRIHFYLDQISTTLEAMDEGTTDVEPLRRLAAQLQGLKEQLVEHHGSEERGGVFTAILEVLPGCRVEVDRLVNQHARMIEILELARIHAQNGEPGEAHALRVDLVGFLDTFRSHERDEERLIRQALAKERNALG